MPAPQDANTAPVTSGDDGADAGECRAAGALFSLLGRCLEEEADRGLLEALRGPLREPLAAWGVDPGAGFYEAPLATLQDELAEEFTGLFVAPGAVSPYHSVFETGAMFREPCDRAAAAYQRAGWDFRRRLSGEFPDHVGTMLGFVGMLYQREAEQREAGEAEAAAGTAALRREFTLEELGPWAPAWSARAAAAAFHPFYQAVLRLAEAVLWRELESLAGRRQLRELANLNRREPKRLDYDADFRKASGL